MCSKEQILTNFYKPLNFWRLEPLANSTENGYVRRVGIKEQALFRVVATCSGKRSKCVSQV
jgi:hypothetical protein